VTDGATRALRRSDEHSPTVGSGGLFRGAEHLLKVCDVTSEDFQPLRSNVIDKSVEFVQKHKDAPAIN